MVVEHSQHIVLIQIVFRGVVGTHVVSHTREKGIEGFQLPEILQAAAGAGFKFFLQILLAHGFVEAQMGEEYQTRVYGIQRRLGSVVHPGGTEDFRHLILPAGLQGPLRPAYQVHGLQGAVAGLHLDAQRHPLFVPILE